MKFETKNLKLISCNTEILKAAISGNEQLANKLKVIVEDNWTEFGVNALSYVLHRIADDKEAQGWWTYLPILKKENKLIGSGGYKGKPTNSGIVELGYEIASGYRNRGLATEMTKGLIENAFKYKYVNTIIAHTLSHDNPSTKVLLKNGFNKIAEINDPDKGLLWKWELKRL